MHFNKSSYKKEKVVKPLVFRLWWEGIMLKSSKKKWYFFYSQMQILEIQLMNFWLRTCANPAIEAFKIVSLIRCYQRSPEVTASITSIQECHLRMI